MFIHSILSNFSVEFDMSKIRVCCVCYNFPYDSPKMKFLRKWSDFNWIYKQRNFSGHCRIMRTTLVAPDLYSSRVELVYICVRFVM